MVKDGKVKRMENGMMMDYTQFKEALKAALQEHFLGRGQVYYDNVVKTNDTSKEAVVVWQFGTAVRTTIYPEDIYEGYQQTGDFEKCAEEVIRACDMPLFINEGHIPKTWETAKRRLCMRVINRNWNREALKRLLHREYLDLAVVYYVFIKEEGGMAATLPVSRECMEFWGVDVKDLWEAARNNLREEEFRIEMMETVLEDVLMENGDAEAARQFREEAQEAEEMGLYVVFNRNRSYGARAILRKDLLREFARERGGSFYILPCSVHEIILLKESKIFTVENLKDMVYQINHCTGAVGPEECLSDSIYYYNEDTDRVVLVA